jgi:peptidoglycan L-alanyl-D-glutamate endopeptidase CwlK
MANNGVLVGTSVWDEIETLRESDLGCCAPLFRAAVMRGLARANGGGFPLKIEETCRCQRLQDIYFAQGTTHAQSVLRAWHAYGAAVDVVHPERGWDLYPGGRSYSEAWVTGVVTAMKAEGLLSWGGDWTSFKDYPHWQHGKCKPTPSDEAVRLYQAAGKAAVWKAIGAA